MDCRCENEEEKDVKNQQKGLLIVLASLVVVSLIVIVGVFIFFPFDSHNKPTVIIEKDLPYQKSHQTLKENKFISNLEQNSQTSHNETKKGTLAEEFFIEVLPESEKENPASLTKPIKAEPPKVNTNKSSNEAPQVANKKKDSVAKEIESKNVANSNEAVKGKQLAKNYTEAPDKPKIPSFWIQLGSYSDERLANNVIAKIKQEGFEAYKHKFNDGSRILFRVRMGPYSNKKEANKFLTWIQELPDFKSSYILQTNT